MRGISTAAGPGAILPVQSRDNVPPVSQRRGNFAGYGAFIAVLFSVVVLACSKSVETPFVPPIVFDAGMFGFDEGGIDLTIGEPCIETAQCDDGIACTFDRCDEEIGRCRHTPDDAQCQNNVYCDGAERCLPRIGCQPGAPEACSDNDTCSIDRCVEASRSCEHTTRDADNDGDGTAQCQGGRDCDDRDPIISSLASEVCGNGRDDNCNGIVDELPCTTSANDTCGSARTVTTSGTYFLSTFAAQPNYALSCRPTGGSALRDVVANIVVPSDGPHDVEVWASAGIGDLVFALERTCGEAATEIDCTVVPSNSMGRILAHSLAPGEYALVVAATFETQIDLNVGILPPTPMPTNETCLTATPIESGVPTSIKIAGARADLDTSCLRSGGDLTYEFDLGAPADVRVYSAVTRGTGKITTSLRDTDAGCTEVRCKNGSAAPLFARNLAPGTHRVSVSATQSVDGTLLLQTSPPTTAAPDETCATAPSIINDTTFSVDLTNHDASIDTGCLPGAPNAAYRLDLAVASDVLLVARFAGGDVGGISLHGANCTMTDSLGCKSGGTPVRLSKRNLPPGSYRIVVAQEDGRPATLSAFVRPTFAPVSVTSDTCANAYDIPTTGGYFTGNTALAAADYLAGCDGAGTSNAKDQMLKLTLPERKRVVFDMTGSLYTTILDIRDTSTCPGAERGSCFVGFGADRSFLDQVLPAGSYWVQVDGYSGESGVWSLDVRVAPPP